MQRGQDPESSPVYSNWDQERPPTSPKTSVNNALIVTVFLEAIALGGIAALAYFLRFTDTFDVFPSAFYAGDMNLNYPYLEDVDAPEQFAGYKSLFENTDKVLYCVCFLLPPLLILLGEFGVWLFSSKPQKSVWTLWNVIKVAQLSRRIVRNIGVFWLGAVLLSIVSDVVSLVSGKQRPNFKRVCKLSDTAGTGTDGLAISTNDCTTTDTDALRDAQLAFPCYYAVLSSYAAAFAMIYVHNVYHLKGTYILRPVIMFGLLVMTIAAGWSEYMQYRNDWKDLLAGYLLGTGFAIYFAVFLLNSFMERSWTWSGRPRVVGVPGRAADSLPTKPGDPEEAASAGPRWMWSLPRLTIQGLGPAPLYTDTEPELSSPRPGTVPNITAAPNNYAPSKYPSPYPLLPEPSPPYHQQYGR